MRLTPPARLAKRSLVRSCARAAAIFCAAPAPSSRRWRAEPRATAACRRVSEPACNSTRASSCSLLNPAMACCVSDNGDVELVASAAAARAERGGVDDGGGGGSGGNNADDEPVRWFAGLVVGSWASQNALSTSAAAITRSNQRQRCDSTRRRSMWPCVDARVDVTAARSDSRRDSTWATAAARSSRRRVM